MTMPITPITFPGRVTRAILVAGAALAPLPLAVAQTALYSNGSPDPAEPGLATGPITASGVPAPAGALWSEAQADDTGAANAVGGFSSHLTGATGAYRFADDFTVTAPGGWRLTSASFYAYQTGAPAGASPFSGLTLRLWSGRPDDAGSTVLFGDATTNRLLTSTGSDLYRVFSTVTPPYIAVPDATRLIWRTDAGIDAPTGLLLAPGTYWVDWQYTSIIPGAEAFSPPVTVADARALPGWNARQFKTGGGGAWADVLDTGKPAYAADVAQDLPFILRGSVACTADFNGDGTVNVQDFLSFLGAYAVGDPRADVNADGITNIQDFLAFLTIYTTGCA